nr:MAG TPA: hypothetical protein [Bacteriophage sp.]DAI57966.1 MAG TPA: hypothetical protein [Caudoviricetes sp.]
MIALITSFSSFKLETLTLRASTYVEPFSKSRIRLFSSVLRMVVFPQIVIVKFFILTSYSFL